MIVIIIVAVAVLIIATISFFASKYNEIIMICMEIEDSIVDIGRTLKQGFKFYEEAKEKNDKLEVVTDQVVLSKKDLEDTSRNEEVIKQKVVDIKGMERKLLEPVLTTIDIELKNNIEYYNSLVEKYNKTISSFPTKITAKIFKFTPL